MQLLGKGSFGSVYSVRRIVDRSLHVMKKISIHDLSTKERKKTEQECKVLERLRHPGKLPDTSRSEKVINISDD